MGARDLTAAVASANGVPVSQSHEFDNLIARVRKALSRSKVGLVREGRCGNYKWTFGPITAGP